MTAKNSKNETVTGLLAGGQRWSVGRKRDVVLRLLRGEKLSAEMKIAFPAGNA